MVRFAGKVGYATSSETSLDVWTDSIVEHVYRGSILNRSIAQEEGDKVHNDLRLSSRISLVADPYALDHYSKIKYVKDEGGVYWAVTNVELKRPRLILSLGGVYNGPRA